MSRKLRVRALDVPFRLVLVEPEIPQNTGNIARLCAATQCPLHLCGRLGFRIDERAVRRAGIDYWHLVDLHVHPGLSDFTLAHPTARLRLFSANGPRSYLDAELRPGDALVFGKESSGLPPELLERHADHVYGIPTAGAVRSLNLASAAAIVLYDALRRVGGLDHAALEPDPADAPSSGRDFVR